MKDKIIIWILGALSSGKTTQNKLLLENLGNGPRVYHSGTQGETFFAYTTYGDICSLGKIDETQCCGLDRVSSRMKNEGLVLSLQLALKKCDIVVVESIMSASTWFDLLKKFDTNLFIFRLDTTFEENARRLRWRQWSKANGMENEPYPDFEDPDLDPAARLSEKMALFTHPLTDANYEFIRKTRMQYENIFNKFIKEPGVKGAVIDANRDPQLIHTEIVSQVYFNL